MTPSTKQRLEELEESKKDIETAIVCEKLQRPEITKPHIIHFITKFRDMNIDDINSRKRLIDSFVNSIYLYDDKIIFSFNYSDSTHELSLKELEDEMSSGFNALSPPEQKNTLRRVFLFLRAGTRILQGFGKPQVFFDAVKPPDRPPEQKNTLRRVLFVSTNRDESPARVRKTTGFL